MGALSIRARPPSTTTVVVTPPSGAAAPTAVAAAAADDSKGPALRRSATLLRSFSAEGSARKPSPHALPSAQGPGSHWRSVAASRATDDDVNHVFRRLHHSVQFLRLVQVYRVRLPARLPVWPLSWLHAGLGGPCGVGPSALLVDRDAHGVSSRLAC